MIALCDTLEVSRAGYYAWLAESNNLHQQRDRELMPLVCNIFWQHKRRYGTRRIAVELSARGQPCGVDRVAKLLKMQGLRAIQPQSLGCRGPLESSLRSDPFVRDTIADVRNAQGPIARPDKAR